KPVELTGLEADLKTDAGRWAVDGKADDQHWGVWSVTGHSDLTTGEVLLDLRADGAQVSPARLRALPFVSPGVWDHVTGEGPARAVDLQPFTRTWPLPPQLRDISGRLTGEAKLALEIGERVHVTGTGQGRVEDAVLQPKQKGDEPIKINDLRLRLFYVDGKPQ